MQKKRKQMQGTAKHADAKHTTQTQQKQDPRGAAGKHKREKSKHAHNTPNNTQQPGAEKRNKSQEACSKKKIRRPL